MKKTLLILLSLIMCLSVFASCADKDDTSSPSHESKHEESGQNSSESSEVSSKDISEEVSENESETTDNNSSENESDDSNEASNEDPDNKSDDVKNVASGKLSKYYMGEYTLDINTYASKYGSLCEMYSYTGKNDGDSLIDIVNDKSVSDDTVLFLGENYKVNPMDDELFKTLHKNVTIAESSPYVKNSNGIFESVIPSDEDWLNRTREIVGEIDLSDYCVNQYSKIPYFMSVGYYTVGTLREMANNDVITFYFTRLPEPEKGERWLGALAECGDINCKTHK